MPIFEYLCEDCGTKFEKLVRNAPDAPELACPSCGKTHLKQEFSTFAPKVGGSASAAPAPPCANGGRCQPGMCGMAN
jgi:putative FmdB family regulatory protein